MAGNGGPAAGQAALAGSRMQHLPSLAHPDPEHLLHLARLSRRIDAAVGRALEHGITQRVYLQRGALLDLHEDPAGTTAPTYQPVTPDLRSALRTTLRDTLGIVIAPPPPSSDVPDTLTADRAHVI